MATALNPGRLHDLGRNRYFILFGFSPLGVDKWGGLLADFVLWASIVAHEARTHRSVPPPGRIVDRGQRCLGVRDLGVLPARSQLRHNRSRILGLPSCCCL
jgi:hypothetical protein